MRNGGKREGGMIEIDHVREVGTELLSKGQRKRGGEEERE